MPGRVPLSRRNLLADRRRLAASVVGVGLAVMLVLLLDGMWVGVQRQATVYTEKAGADLYVLQPGVRDLTAGAGSLPLATADAVRADPDVAWASPVRTAYVILQLHARKVPAYLVGSVPGERGGAWSLTAGRTPAADDEITVGKVLADRHGVRVGDSLEVMGRSLRVVGLSRTTGFMVSYVFVTHATLDRLSASVGKTSFVLVGTTRPDAVAGRLRAAGLNVLGRDEVSANNLDFATGVFGSPVRLMVAIGLAAGAMIIALTESRPPPTGAGHEPPGASGPPGALPGPPARCAGRRRRRRRPPARPAAAGDLRRSHAPGHRLPPGIAGRRDRVPARRAHHAHVDLRPATGDRRHRPERRRRGLGRGHPVHDHVPRGRRRPPAAQLRHRLRPGHRARRASPSDVRARPCERRDPAGGDRRRSPRGGHRRHRRHLR